MPYSAYGKEERLEGEFKGGERGKQLLKIDKLDKIQEPC